MADEALKLQSDIDEKLDELTAGVDRLATAAEAKLKGTSRRASTKHPRLSFALEHMDSLPSGAQPLAIFCEFEVACILHAAPAAPYVPAPHLGQPPVPHTSSQTSPGHRRRL